MDLNVTPEALTTASNDLARIASCLEDGNLTAILPTTGIIPAAADEISAAITQLFNAHGINFQGLMTQAQQLHQQFVTTMSADAAAYTNAESVNTQQLLNAVNAPFLAETGRPLIGDGANGTMLNPNGQPGGWLIGNGGNGFSQPAGGGNGGMGGAAGLIGNGGNGGNGGSTTGTLIAGQITGPNSGTGGTGGNGGLIGTAGTGGSSGSATILNGGLSLFIPANPGSPGWILQGGYGSPGYNLS